MVSPIFLAEMLRYPAVHPAPVRVADPWLVALLPRLWRRPTETAHPLLRHRHGAAHQAETVRAAPRVPSAGIYILTIVLAGFCRRPRAEKRPCNTGSCEAEWVAGLWEPCTASCGKAGGQYREVYCRPLWADQTVGAGQLWRQSVAPHHCHAHPAPPRSRPCNRLPCSPAWQEQGWTQCSATCGLGDLAMVTTELM